MTLGKIGGNISLVFPLLSGVAPLLPDRYAELKRLLLQHGVKLKGYFFGFPFALGDCAAAIT